MSALDPTAIVLTLEEVRTMQVRFFFFGTAYATVTLVVLFWAMQ